MTLKTKDWHSIMDNLLDIESIAEKSLFNSKWCKEYSINQWGGIKR
jgi:hypothetical protein